MKADGEALLDAVRERKRGVAKTLIRAKANLCYTNSFGWTSLHWAADRGLLEVTNLLLDYNADVNARDLNEATPIIAAARANCLATARALMARGAQLDLLDEWEDSALTVAQATGHTKMSAQLKAASRGALGRLKGAKVVWSYPPSLYQPLKKLVTEVRYMPGGEGIYGVHEELRMAVEVTKDEGLAPDEAEEADEGSSGSSPATPAKGQSSSSSSSPTKTPGSKGQGTPGSSSSSAASPTKVTWAGPDVTWCQACARATLAVQIAPETDEYKQNEACQEQILLLHARAKIDSLRHDLKQDAMIVLPVKEEDAPPSPFWDEVEDLRDEAMRLDKVAERLRYRLRHFDDRISSDRQYFTRLTSGATAKSLKEDRMEELQGFLSEVAKLGDAVAPELERVHEVLKNVRHARLEDEIEMIDEAVAKLQDKIRPLPKEPSRDASSKEQETYKAEHAKIKGDNEKLDKEITMREKRMKMLKAKLHDDLKTLEKPHPAPAYIVSISLRHFERLDPRALTLWLNWQTETNGIVPKKASSPRKH